jgi:3,4-dihydroxy 2-butanone 4-phosphate synthase/GTP cyclohydrolase II
LRDAPAAIWQKTGRQSEREEAMSARTEPEAGHLDRIEAAIEAIGRGEMIVVVDDEDRENEGDLIMAAEAATPEKVAFMIRHTSGILCAPLTAAEARRLHLDPMVAVNDAPLGTAFTVSVDFRHGLTTGISAEERCATIRGLANPNSGADDFVRPGHVFPLIAREGGVLIRSGHTEAGTDLARLAGRRPVGLLAELVNDDGTVRRGPEVLAFAREHALKIVSVAQLIAYRQQRERLVERQAELPVQSVIGPARGIVYGTHFDQVQHLAIVFGALADGKDVPVRLHREDIIRDVFGSREVLTRAFERFQHDGRGVLVYLREGTAGGPATSFQEDTTPSEASRLSVWRDIGLGAQILRDLGIASIRLLATSNRRYVAVEGFGITIAGTDIIDN